MRLTISVPSAHIDDANHLAMVLGYAEADNLTYRDPSWQDAAGNLYSAASLPVSESFFERAKNTLIRPEWDTENIIDMAAAINAQAKIVLWKDETDGPIPQAQPNKITAIVNNSGVDALRLMGLTPVYSEEI